MTEGFGSICAIILAAGESKRFGSENKLLVELDGVSILERVVRCILGTGIEPTVVITGEDHERMASLLSASGLECIHNPDWRTGMGSSLAEGAQWIGEQTFSGILVCLGDLPYLDPGTVRQVLERFRANAAEKIVMPTCNGRRGHPVVFPYSFLQRLMDLKGDEGAKSLIQSAESNI